MPSPLGSLSVEEFLANYWQKKPCLVRSAFPDFEPELDGDDLAGLACEPMVEARIVSGSYPAHDWQLLQGPFDEDIFANLTDSDWTLLVQDVEKHYPPLSELMEQFDFLPTWRLDDLMISWAAPGGSVGPHVDQYDVFLLQVEGTRRWQIAKHFDPELLSGTELNVLRRFEAEKEWVLEPGDMLYLPPGVAHHGIALTAGMTWSIGARAPDAADLLMALGESLAGDHVPRYSDPNLQAPTRPGEIDARALDRFHELMSASLQNPEAFKCFAGSFLSRFRMAQEPAPPDEMVENTTLERYLSDGALLFRNPWTRLAWVQQDDRAMLFAAGTPLTCSIELAEILCARQQHDLLGFEPDPVDLEALTELINAGHLVMSKG